MEVSDVQELHYITPIANLPSILKHGIVSHRAAERLNHDSVAMAEIQDIRATVRVPGGMPLHEYVNLYFNSRNPMMYKRSARHRSLCVLRIRPDVLYLEGVVITDQNAASKYRRWSAFPEGLVRINKDRIFAGRWTDHEDPIERFRHTSEMCAEALIPSRVNPEYISGVYVSCAASATAVRELECPVPVMVNGYIFFFTAIGRPI